MEGVEPLRLLESPRSVDKTVAQFPQTVSHPQVEQVKGIEPSSEAWKAPALPLSYARNFTQVKRKRPPVLQYRRP